jgi:transcriptional regulator with XRE-family HTH domain
MNEISSRITKIMEEQQLSSAAFADTIGVQRSSISHILSGRNKPSLDFVLKTIHAFPSYSADWLLFGKQSEQPIQAPEETLPVRNDNTSKTKEPAVKAIKMPVSPPPASINTNQNSIDKVVLLLNDGSFKEYVPKKE